MVENVADFCDFVPKEILWYCKFKADMFPSKRIKFVLWTDKQNASHILADHLESRLKAKGPKLVILDDLQLDIESNSKNLKIATHLANHCNAFVLIVSEKNEE